MGALIRKHDWTATSLGPSDNWDQALRTAIELMLESPLVGSIVAGSDRLFFYNDPAAALYGSRHPAALGLPLLSSFPESRAVIPLYDRAFAGETVTIEGQALDVAGEGRGEIFNANLIPVRGADGDVIAVSMSGIEVGERIRIQERLRDSEARYRAFVTASADVVYRMSADWSEMRELDGRGFLADTREARADWMERYIMPAEHERVRKAIDKAIRTKSMFELEHAVIRADGAPGWTYSRAVPIIDDGGRITEWLGAASDITLMRESRERYRLLFEAIDEGFCIVEVMFDGEHPVDYRFVEVNPAFERQTGLHDAERKRMRALRPDHEQFWFDTYGQIARTGIAERFIHEAAALGRWYDVYAFRIGVPEDRRVAILFNDITERKRAEASLRESEARLAAAFESVPAGLAAIDLEGRTVLANADYRKFLPNGIVPSRDPERGDRWKAWDKDGQLVAPENYPAARALRGERVIPGLEMLYSDDDGREIWTNVATVPTYGDADRVTGVVAVISDVDERKRAEIILRANEERQRYLLKLSDALRPVADPAEIQGVAMRVLGEQLQVSRAQYYEATPDGEHVVGHGAYAQGIAPVFELVRMDDFGEFVRADFAAGRTVVVTDAASGPRVSKDQLKSYDSYAFRAYVAVPLVKGGRFVACLGVHSAVPRQWTADEIALVEETAERTWLAVERARVEQALRDSEEHQKT